MTDRCSVSVQASREPIISSSLIVKVWNKHEWTSEGIMNTQNEMYGIIYLFPLISFQNSTTSVEQLNNY